MNGAGGTRASHAKGQSMLFSPSMQSGKTARSGIVRVLNRSRIGASNVFNLAEAIEHRLGPSRLGGILRHNINS